MSQKKVYLVGVDEKRMAEFPVISSTLGPHVYDIRTLFEQTGYFIYDSAFLSTASCDSQIAYVDGAEGNLLYRGYDIENLTKESSFLETDYLLIYGDLPKAQDLSTFEETIRHRAPLHEQISCFYKGFRPDGHLGGCGGSEPCLLSTTSAWILQMQTSEISPTSA